MNSRFCELLLAEVAPFCTLSASQVERLAAHYELLERWNRKTNLTAIRSLEGSVTRHYAECLFFASRLPCVAGDRILDVGSGAGFPGIPLAVLRPECHVTLLDSHRRKAVFLREGARGLSNVRVAAERVESHAGEYEWLVSRAVRPREIVARMPLLASRAGVLLGEADAADLLSTPGITSEGPITLPGGERRSMLVFDVPRGT